VRVVASSVVPYEHPFTYDILPDSDTGAYFAGGLLIGSTLADEATYACKTAPVTAPARE
jgi:hypothetical protein